MLQPHYITIQIQTPDLIKELIEVRRSQLQKKYPYFKQSFDNYQKKYQAHYQHLKSMDINNSISYQEQSAIQLKRKVLDQLERKEYLYFKNKKKYIERQSSALRNNFTGKNEKNNLNNPYHFNKFQKELGRFQLRYDQRPKFVQQASHRNFKHLKAYSIDQVSKQNQIWRSLNKQSSAFKQKP